MLLSRWMLLCLLPLVDSFTSSEVPKTKTALSRADSRLQAHSTRRDVLEAAGKGIVASSLVGLSTPSWAAGDPMISQLVSPQATSAGLESGLLESRVLSNVLNPPPYGMEGPDVYYPS